MRGSEALWLLLGTTPRWRLNAGASLRIGATPV